MKRMLIRYRTKPECTDENRRLVEDVFRELREKAPKGVRYAVLKLGEDAFAHLVEAEDGTNPLTQLEAFQRFVAGVKARCVEPPQSFDADVVGNYGMLDGASRRG